MGSVRSLQIFKVRGEHTSSHSQGVDGRDGNQHNLPQDTCSAPGLVPSPRS